MPDTSKSRAVTPSFPLPAPPPAATSPGAPPSSVRLQDAVAAAEAAVAAGERQVRIAGLLLDELPDDALPSARAVAEDRVAGAEAGLAAARTRARRSLDAVCEAEEAPDEPPLPTLVYPDVDTWVRSWLLPCWRRPLRQRWCPKWWLHAEAVSRLEALWRAWEHLRGEGALGPSVWWRDHADHHLAVLASERGPFAACSPDRGHRAGPDELPAVADPLDLADFVGRSARRTS